MTDVKVDRIVGEGTARFTVVVREPEDVWRQESGLPGYVEWSLYRIEFFDHSQPEDQVLHYWRKGAPSNIDETPNWEDAEPAARGTVKWDGCCNFDVEGMHVCGAEDLAGFCKALQRAYALAAEMVGVEGRAE